MSVILSVGLPVSEFAIGRIIDAVDGVHIELESVVPLGNQAMPLLEVHDHDHESFAQRLQEHPAVASVVVVQQSDDIGTYAVNWTADPGAFYQAVHDHDVVVLSTVKDGNQWYFDLQFLSHDTLTAFREQINETDIDLTIYRVSHSQQSIPTAQKGLSTAQHEAVDLAVSEGYYSIPRETTTAELSDQLGISDQAVIERLRRAVTTLGEEYIAASHDRADI